MYFFKKNFRIISLLFLNILIIFPLNSFGEVINNSSNNYLVIKNRFLILNTQSLNSFNHKKLNEFENINKCEINNRNLIFITAIHGKNSKYNDLFKFIKLSKNYGFSLVGYDGKIKMFFHDPNSLYIIFDKIDTMPIRKTEIIDDKLC